MVEPNGFHFCKLIGEIELVWFQPMVKFPRFEKILKKSTLHNPYR
jgi:hypothetical protein